MHPPHPYGSTVPRPPPGRTGRPALSWLHVDGDRIADEHGRTVVLAGAGLGGWMNVENFVTGYPGSEQDTRRLLRAAMGEDAYRAFFDTFLTAFFDEADARYLASLGLNSVRIPVNCSGASRTTTGRWSGRRTGSPPWTGSSPSSRGTASTPSSTCTRCPARRITTGTVTTPPTAPRSGPTATSRTGP